MGRGRPPAVDDDAVRPSRCAHEGWATTGRLSPVPRQPGCRRTEVRCTPWRAGDYRSALRPGSPGPLLEAGVSDLVDWLRTDHSSTLGPLFASAMSHYQFEP